MPTKDELLAQAEEAGIEVPSGAKKAEIEDLLAGVEPEAEATDDAQEPLEGTPVVADTEYVPLGEPVEEIGFGVDDTEPVKGEAKDEPRKPLEASPHEVEVFDTSVGSSRPEDGFVSK